MRRTWLVGDGPCKFLADRDRRHQRHHLMLYGSDAPTDTPTATRSSRRHADLSVRDLSGANKQSNARFAGSSVNGGTQNMYLGSKGILHSKDIGDKITATDRDFKKTLMKPNVPGKIGSGHWAAKGPASNTRGSWEVKVYDPAAWEDFRMRPMHTQEPMPRPQFNPRERTPSNRSEASFHMSPKSALSASLGVRD